MTTLVNNTHDVTFYPKGDRKGWKAEIDKAQEYNQRILSENTVLVRYARRYKQHLVWSSVHDAYIPIEKSKIIGTMVATRIGSSLYFGWSLHNTKDLFSKKIGLATALNRMFKVINGGDGGHPELLPHSLTDDFNWFVDRSNKYFKILI